MADGENEPVPEQTPTDGASLEEAPENDADALEAGENAPADGQPIDATGDSDKAPAPSPKPSAKQKLKKVNIYLLSFAFLLLLTGGIIGIAYLQSKKAASSGSLKTQDLTESTLQQLANSDANVGSSQQVLNVQSSAVFAGKVLVRDDLEVAGSLRVGGTVALNNLTVGGTVQFGQVQVNKNLAVAGDTAVQGGLTVAKSLQVNGGGTFSGAVSAPQITTSNLQLNGNLTLTHHITAGGAPVGRSNGTALGAGGSSTVSGSDTAGTVNINVGSGAGAGCFTTVNFTSKYNSTPRVLITPVGSGAGGLSYYINRSTSNFSICVSTPAPAGSSFGFDYFVVE